MSEHPGRRVAARLIHRLSILTLAALAACASPDDPDASGLNAAEKRALVERYYACATAGRASCVRDTLHPAFEATDHRAGPMNGAVHAETLLTELRRSRVDPHLLPHDGAEVWVTELWIDRYGGASNRLRAFGFAERRIRTKTPLAG